jgi:hypothetical protein
MYLDSASPILPGDRERAARHLACEAARRNDAATQSVKGRVALFRTITSPADLAVMFGPQLGANALMMQNDTAVSRQDSIMGTGAGASDPAGTASTGNPARAATGAYFYPGTASQQSAASVQQIIDAAPKSYSLNGQPSQVNGCKWAPAPQVPAPPSPTPTMPLRAPVVIQTPIGPASMPPGTQPRYSNLCWALRNGLVAQDQFDPSEYGKLYRKCAELGYAGGCPSPRDVNVWFNAQRQAGTLPHISVSDADLASIPHAPNLETLSCAQAMIAGGLTGYAPPWSDALVTDSQQQMDNPDTGVAGWIASHPWLSLAIAVGGAVALSRRNR